LRGQALDLAPPAEIRDDELDTRLEANYSILDVSADGSSLTVDVWGIPSYQQNTFPQDGPVVGDILGFTIQAGFLATVSAPTSIMLLAVGLAGLALLGRVRA